MRLSWMGSNWVVCGLVLVGSACCRNGFQAVTPTDAASLPLDSGGGDPFPRGDEAPTGDARPGDSQGDAAELPPTRFGGSPTGALPSDTLRVVLHVETDRSCTCRYGPSDNVAFDDLSAVFTMTGGTFHEETIAPLGPGDERSYFVRCRDDVGATNPDSYPVSFSVNAVPAVIYRSVGPTNSAALATGAANALTVIDAPGSDADSRATFAGSLPTRVGLGDALQYDASGDGVVDAIAFIYGRLSASSYRVRSDVGGRATPTVGPDLDWSVFRAYTSLSDAEVGTENSGINGAVDNFANLTTPKDLVADNQVWSIACYADAAETVGMAFYDIGTGPANFIRVFTPQFPYEVGASQRHDGKWNDSAFRITKQPNADWRYQMSLQVGYIRVEGLQFLNQPGAFQGSYSLHVLWSNPGDMRISENIFRGLPTADVHYMAAIVIADPSTTNYNSVRVFNNVVADFKFSGGTSDQHAIRVEQPVESFFYNNTLYHSAYGFSGSFANSILLNNLAILCDDGFASSSGYRAESDWNLSDLTGDAPGPHALAGVPSFVAPTVVDLHLDPADTVAADAGVNLSQDPTALFDTDIDGQTRTGPWDLGADERQP